MGETSVDLSISKVTSASDSNKIVDECSGASTELAEKLSKRLDSMKSIKKEAAVLDEVLKNGRGVGDIPIHSVPLEDAAENDKAGGAEESKKKMENNEESSAVESAMSIIDNMNVSTVSLESVSLDSSADAS